MRVRVATLCDAATVRDDLLNVLSAGISVSNVGAFPTPLNVTLALLIEIEASEVGIEHSVELRVVSSGGDVLGGANGQFSMKESEAAKNPLTRNGPGSVPLALPLEQITIPEPGEYRLELTVNGEHEPPLRFFVVPIRTEADVL